MSPEEEKKDMEQRKRMFTYNEALHYFVEEADIEDELREIQNTKERPDEDTSMLQKMISCCAPKPKLAEDLRSERDEVFAVAKVKYNSQIAEHEIIVKTIYKKLMKTD